MAGDETDVRLARMRGAMGKLLRQGRRAEFDAVAAAYAALKASAMEEAEEEHRAEVRARRAAVRAAEERRPERWRLPRGFGRSPMAQERDRMPQPPDAPQVPPGGLRPWRRGWWPPSEQIWRPGR